MFKSISWLKTRNKQIISILIDLIIFIYIQKNNLLPLNFNILILFFWISYCYIFGKYIFTDSKKLVILKRQFFSFILSFVFIGLIIIFLPLLTNNTNIIYLFRNNFIKVIFTSFLINTTINILCRNSNFNINKWVFYGSKLKFDALLEDLNSCGNKIKLTFKKQESPIQDLRNLSGYIIDPSHINPQELKLLNIEQNKKIYTLDSWLRNFIQRYPVSLISDDVIYEKIISKNIIGFQFRIKRLFEIIFSLILIIFSLPLIIIAITLVYLEDRNMPFYTQQRSGKDSKIFKITKIRTMIIDAEKDKAIWAKNKDTRITKVGYYIRKFRIDELPQLLSVINGNMSLIGPRPERPEIDNNLVKKIKNYKLRYKMRPGISGWAQVNYPYGSSIEDSKNKLSYDLFYISNYSIFLDLLILFKTIKLVVNGKGYSPKKINNSNFIN